MIEFTTYETCKKYAVALLRDVVVAAAAHWLASYISMPAFRVHSIEATTVEVTLTSQDHGGAWIRCLSFPSQNLTCGTVK